MQNSTTRIYYYNIFIKVFVVIEKQKQTKPKKWHYYERYINNDLRNFGRHKSIV